MSSSRALLELSQIRRMDAPRGPGFVGGSIFFGTEGGFSPGDSVRLPPFRRKAQAMKFWRNNRIDGTFEAPIEQVVTQFRASTWWTADLDVESAVRLFLTDTDGPVSAVWDDEADLAEVCARALAAGWTGAAGSGQAAVA